MDRGGKKRRKPVKKKKDNDDGLVPSLSEIKKDKHRSCESKRRQQENNAFATLHAFLESSKKYKHTASPKLDRLHLLSGAAMYIQENSAALNIMVGVLCNMLACCPEMQNAMMELGNSGEELTQNRLLERFGVPASIDELLDSIYQSRAMEPMAHYPAPMLPSFDV
ncbi:hypothetical protein WA577_000206 [Blastocystis sp. JDR]